MKLWRKIAIGIACLAVVCGAAILWRAHQRHALSEKIIAATRARAAQGDPKAQSKLASIYYYGKGTKRDYGEAVRWARKAADQGLAEAEYALGVAYYEGDGVPQDYSEAIRWYRKAADQGYSEAQYGLGYLFYNGAGVPQDYAEALRWYRKAADQGYAEAQYSLGTLYYYGKGVPQDYGETARWYRKAANQGYKEAQFQVGEMYYHGRGVQQDYAEAFRWYHKAAKQGDPNAQRVLQPQLTTLGKVWIAIEFLGTTFLLVSSYRSAARELLGLSYLALVCMGLFHLGVAQSDMFRFTKNLLAGMVFAMLFAIVWSQGAKFVLKVSSILFIGFNIYTITHYDLIHDARLARLFYLTNGLLIGMAIPSASAIYLRNDQDKKEPHNGVSVGPL